MFRDLRIEPLRLVYEDVVERPQEAVAQVADYLGVALDPAAAVDVPSIDKQSEAGRGKAGRSATRPRRRSEQATCTLASRQARTWNPRHDG
jgi:hypothetical protein